MKNKYQNGIGIFALLFIAFLNYCFIFSCGERKSRVKKVQVSMVDFYTLTFTNINSDEFENYFINDLEKFDLSENKIEKFCSLIDSLELNEDNVEINVRAKIVIFKKNNLSDTLYAGMDGVIMNNKKYKQSLSLIYFLQNQIGL